MSLYKSIKKTLFGLYKSKQKGHSKRRLLTMAGMITGLLRSKKGTIHSIGKRFPSQSDLESRIKRVKRSLGNKWNDWAFQYLPCLQKILQILSKQGHIKLIIDGCQMGSSCTALMLSVLWGDTAIPLCRLVREAPQGHARKDRNDWSLLTLAWVFLDFCTDIDDVIYLNLLMNSA